MAVVKCYDMHACHCMCGCHKPATPCLFLLNSKVVRTLGKSDRPLPSSARDSTRVSFCNTLSYGTAHCARPTRANISGKLHQRSTR